MLRLDKIIKPWSEAGSLNANINLYGFWNETTFLTKSGDLGMVLKVAGVDFESLDPAGQEFAVKRLEAALKAFGPGFHIYQYLFKTNRPEMPFARYGDPLIDAAIDQRREFFDSKRDRLFEIEIYYVVVLEGARSKTGIVAALGRFPSDPSGAVRELKAQFTSNNLKVLLRSQIERDHLRLQQRVEAFAQQLRDLVETDMLGFDEQFHFLRRLLNFDSWRIAGKPQTSQYLDFQVVNSDIEAERDHLRIGDHFVRLLTMRESITETRPLVLDRLLKIEANFYAVTEWTPLATEAAKKEVVKRRRHANMSKAGLISSMKDESTVNQRDVLIDEGKQADIEVLGDCLRALGDGQMLGDLSLTIVLYAEDKSTVDREIADFATVFTNADGSLFPETYNQLNALFAIVPGNYAQNLRKMYMLLGNYADLSFFFTILQGEKHNPHLGTEYLAVMETDNATPYYLNLHNGEVAHTLILGMTGSGKTSALSGIREGAEQNGYAVEGFAPTSRAAGQLRDAGIPADTLQGFLSRGGTERSSGDPNARHLYMLDESSLASTRQMQGFLEKIGPQDRVLLIGDTRQHQGVDAGKPFEQMQEAGMRTSQLDQIVRQKDPELLRAVEHLSRSETNVGIQLLHEQGRVSEIPDRQQRIEAIAKEYVARPENTLIVSPDNASRRDINDAVRAELQRTGVLPAENHQMTVLTQRSELTSADRNWAALYQPEDVLFYTRGSKELGLDRGSYATVVSTDPKENRLTVERQDGQNVSYNPERLHGIAAYREISREFAEGDRLQFTVSKPEMDVKNRDLGTIERIDGISMTVRMDGEKGRSVTFDSSQMRHFDHGYAVTSHSSQGLTTDRVLINMDTMAHPELINTRFAYVSVSRAVSDARIYTNDATTLAERLNTDISKTSAVQLNEPDSQTQERSNTSIQSKENTMTNTREQSPQEQRRQSQDELTPVAVTLQNTTESDQRHYAPLQVALPNENAGYEWRRETGDIQSYQHNESASWLHIDPQGQFYDRHAQPITREHAGHVALAVNEISQAQSLSKGFGGNDQGLSL
jgi:hypothetical protein